MAAQTIEGSKRLYILPKQEALTETTQEQALQQCVEEPALHLEIVQKTPQEFLNFAQLTLKMISHENLGEVIQTSIVSKQGNRGKIMEFTRGEENVTDYVVTSYEDDNFLSIIAQQGIKRTELAINLSLGNKQKGQQPTDEVIFRESTIQDNIIHAERVQKNEAAIESGHGMLLHLKNPDKPSALSPYAHHNEITLRRWARRGLLNANADVTV